MLTFLASKCVCLLFVLLHTAVGKSTTKKTLLLKRTNDIPGIEQAHQRRRLAMSDPVGDLSTGSDASKQTERAKVTEVNRDLSNLFEEDAKLAEASAIA